jgi:peptide-methionine (S)-S-oxide reductase
MTETITLGGGCFWCTEAVMKELRGVERVVSGYCNGHLANPSYQAVCTGTTGHNEVVRVWFDPGQITVREVLEVFFATHDPTTLNRQGNDVGTQYRSGVYYENAAQKQEAEAIIAEMNAEKIFPKPVVTEVKALDHFYQAEDYHQDYFAHHPFQGYCMAVIAPKLSKFRKTYKDKMKS